MSDPVGDALAQVEASLKTHTDAVATLRKAYDATVPPSNVINVTPGSDLKGIVANAPDGAVVKIQPGTYLGPLALNKAVTLRSSVDMNGLPTAAMPVTISCEAGVDTITVNGPDVQILSGIAVKNSINLYQLIATSKNAVRTTIDQVACLGDPVKGQRRGIRIQSNGITITRVLVDHVGLIGTETQAIGCDQGSNILIDHCNLLGAAEAVMFGGSDIPSSDLIPTHIKITNCLLSKRPEWYTMGWQIKNAFELKCAKDVYVGDTLMEYGGTAEGQGAFIMVFTVRNQSGGSPFATIRDVVIERVQGRHGGGCVNILGHDTNHDSDILENLLMRNVKFTDIDPTTGPWKGAGRGFTFDKAPKSVTLEAITVEGGHLSSLGYFPDPKLVPNPSPVALTMRNWKYPQTTYGWKIDNGGLDQPPASKNIQAAMPDMTYAITANDPGAVGYPEFPTT